MGLGDFVPAVAGDLASSVIQGYYNRSSQKRQFKYEKWLRATQYQTAMEDMRKAGLNPILAYKQGGAGVPSISAPSAGRPDIAGSLARLTSSHAQAEKTKRELKLMDAQEDQIKALANKARKEAGLLGNQLEISNAGLEAQRNKNRIYSENPWLQYMSVGGEVLGDFMNSIGSGIVGGVIGKGLRSTRISNKFKRPTGSIADKYYKMFPKGYGSSSKSGVKNNINLIKRSR